MDNPDDEKTTITVKGVTSAAWEKARKAAAKQGQPMGEWLSIAIEQTAKLQEGQRIFPPGKPADKPEPVTPAALGAMMSGMASLAIATGIKPADRTVKSAFILMREQVRSARGLQPPPRQLRPPGKLFSEAGKP